MRLLVITQAIDRDDPVLGFFHHWIEGLAVRFESIEVICLKEGVHALPENVRVHSLGKEAGASRVKYVRNLFRYIWQLRGRYDAIFVHMNQEYVLLAGWLWKLMGKRIYLWRNHHSGGFLTDVASAFTTAIFCTSEYSYTRKFAKSVIMPVGIDTVRFAPHGTRTPRSILSLGRIAPSKKIDVILRAFAILKDGGNDFTASIYGDSLPQDRAYHESLRTYAAEHGLADRVRFLPGVPNDATPPIYAAHRIFVNASESGMYDKTILEAAACGCAVLAASKDFGKDAGEQAFFADADELAHKLAAALADDAPQAQLRAVASKHSLDALMDRLAQHLV